MRVARGAHLGVIKHKVGRVRVLGERDGGLEAGLFVVTVAMLPVVAQMATAFAADEADRS